jgi:hypothetical protein
MDGRQTLEYPDASRYDSNLNDHNEYLKDTSSEQDTHIPAPYCDFCMQTPSCYASDIGEHHDEQCSCDDEYDYDHISQQQSPHRLSETILANVSPLPTSNHGHGLSPGEIPSIPQSTRLRTLRPQGSSLPCRVVKRKPNRKCPNRRKEIGHAPAQAPSVNDPPITTASSVRPHQPCVDTAHYFLESKGIASADRSVRMLLRRLYGMRSDYYDPHHSRPGNRIVPYVEIVHEAHNPRASEVGEGVRSFEVKEMEAVNGDLSTGRVVHNSSKDRQVCPFAKLEQRRQAQSGRIDILVRGPWTNDAMQFLRLRNGSEKSVCEVVQRNGYLCI